MSQQLTSPSSISAESNILRFNSSSCLVSSSQSNFGSHLKQNLIHFQEYKPCLEPVLSNETQCKKIPIQGLGKKKLTIEIDEGFDYGNKNHERQIQEIHDKKQTLRQDRSRLKLTHGIQNEFSEQELSHEINFHISTSNLPHDSQETISQLSKRNEILTLMIQQKDRTLKQLQQKLKMYQLQMQVKIEQSKRKDKQIDNYEYKIRNIELQLQKVKNQKDDIGQLQLSLSAYNQIEQKLKQKDNKVRQLAKINEKLKQLNRDLIRQLKNSQKKVRDLEKQIQNNVCLVTQENIHRLKQSSLKFKEKQNIERHNINYNHIKTERDSMFGPNSLQQLKEKQTCGPRRSFQRKKNGLSNTTSAGQLSQPKKNVGTKMGSSSSNTILNKKMMHK